MEDLSGRQFGPYRIVGPLGEGGMASVYKAYQPAVDRHVALKVLPRHFTADPKYLERFRREAKIVAQLQHPHILPVFDFGESDSFTFLVMPFIDGGTLADLMQGHPIPLDVARRVIRQVGEALDYAHSKGIIHRDIKPSNVLLDEGGNCLVSDFGIARMTDATKGAPGTALTMLGTVMGTPSYMSPEQAGGEPVGPESDMYSLGIVLYEMLTGRVPFTGETPVAVVLKHLNAPLPPPRTINPALSEAVEAVLLKVLARARTDRFPSCAALSAALAGADPGPAIRQPRQTEPAIEQLDDLPPPPTPHEKTEFIPRDPVRDTRNPSPRLIAAILLGIAIVAGAAAAIRMVMNRQATPFEPIPPSIDRPATPPPVEPSTTTTTAAIEAAQAPEPETPAGATPTPPVAAGVDEYPQWAPVMDAAIAAEYDRFETALRDFGGAPKPATADRREARRLNGDALDFVRDHRWGDALPLLDRAHQADAADPEIAANLADTLAHLGRPQEALRFGVASVRLNPRRSPSWSLLGFVYAKLDKPQAAVACLITAHRFSPNKDSIVKAYTRLAETDSDPRVQSAMKEAVVRIGG